MKIKSAPIEKAISCAPSDNIASVAKLLKANKERHIFVLDKDKPLGIISTTDISNRVVAADADPKKKTAREIMTAQVLVKDIEDELGQAYFDMVKTGVLSCAIVAKGKFRGVLYLRDAMTILAREKAERK